MMNSQQAYPRQPVLNLSSSSQAPTSNTEGGVRTTAEQQQYSVQNQNQNQNQNNNNYQTRIITDSSGGGGCWDDLAYSQPKKIQQPSQQQPVRQFQQQQQQEQPQRQYQQQQQQQQPQRQQQQQQQQQGPQRTQFQQLNSSQIQQQAKRSQQSYADGGGGYGPRSHGYNGFMYGQSQGGGWQRSGQNFNYGIKVYITGLAPTVQWRMLKDFLRQAGNVTFASNWKDGTGIVVVLVSLQPWKMHWLRQDCQVVPRYMEVSQRFRWSEVGE
eukprot:TRINITY_DN2481_c0_g1_i8.p1 TRINITY_DN2481_c0_g1~~TRINITY_DN2481_c0_g1_i8.p1  ORF type:complete len:269 (+),score=31.41 TRINITY_DN2481_c0_g1_i8:311-1117(+)